MADVGRSKSPLDWGARMLYGMQQLWRSRHLCDYTIIINQHSFLVHRAFMAAVSDYFYAMLTGGMQETYKDSVELKGVPENCFQPLLEFLYTGKLTLTTDNVCSVLIASAYLQIEPAVHYCSRFLEGAISPDNVLDILDVAKLYSLIDVKSAAMSYILQHFESVAQRQGHVRLEYDLVWFRGLTPQQQPGSYQGGEMMMKSVFWWRKPEHPEETTDLRQVTDETFSHIRPLPSPGIELGPQRCEAK